MRSARGRQLPYHHRKGIESCPRKCRSDVRLQRLTDGNPGLHEAISSRLEHSSTPEFSDFHIGLPYDILVPHVVDLLILRKLGRGARLITIL